MKTETFTKQILFTTTRILANNQKSVGTGFLIEKTIDSESKQFFLVTNKHVIAEIKNNKLISKFDNGSFSFLTSDSKSPQLGKSIFVNITKNFTDSFLFHPKKEVDLAILNVTGIIDHVINKLMHKIFIKAISLDMIPSDAEEFDAVEDVLFIGYPNGIFDEINHLPMIRKGITSLPFEVDFFGKKRFVIDAQVFPGSSGSPVFITRGLIKNDNGSISFGNNKPFFAGVISAVFIRTEKGEIKQHTAPSNSSNGEFLLNQMIGLGICEKSNQILELLKIENKKNWNVSCDIQLKSSLT